MKLIGSILAIALNFSLVSVSFLSFSTQTVTAQDSKIALQRGYRTGYSDGYMAGYRDAIDNTARGYERHSEYTKADRAYSKDYGLIEDYKDGYKQGFESGYNTGYEKRSFDATLPTTLAKRGTTATNTTNQNTSATTNPPVLNQKPEVASSPISGEQIVIIPTDTELIIEILGDLNTDKNKEGDKFQARIVSPYEITGALIDGHITKIQKPGRISRRAQMQLSFDMIKLSDTRWSNFNAIVTEVMPIKGDNVKLVDNEGSVKGKSTIKSDSIKVGAATATGAGVGLIVGGPVGAAVGAGVGAAFGVGAIVVERGKHIKLTNGQQLKIKTSYETTIR